MSKLRKTVTSSLYLFLDGIGQRVIGIISTLILARLLTPEDFGLIAVVSLLLTLFEVFAKNTGGVFVGISKSDGKELLNILFTVNLLQKSFVSIVFLAFIPLVVNFYQEERLRDVLYILILSVFMTGLSNPSLELLKKEQEYKRFIVPFFFLKIAITLITITVAYLNKNYWALVIGQALSNILPVFLGYAIAPYQPKLQFTGITKIFRFTCWSIPNELFGFFRSQLDVVLASKMFNASELGGYHMMKYYALIPNHYIIGPMFQPLLVQLSTVSDNVKHFTKMFNVSFFVQAVACLPLGFFLFFNSEYVIRVLLGDQWVQFSSIFALFSLAASVGTLVGMPNNVLTINNKLRSIFYLNIYSMILNVVLLYFMYFLSGSLTGKSFGYARLVSEVVLVISAFYYVYRFYLDKSRMYFLLYFILLVSIANLLSCFTSSLTPVDSSLFFLVLKVLVFFLVYVIILFLGVLLGAKSIDECRFVFGKIFRNKLPDQ